MSEIRLLKVLLLIVVMVTKGIEALLDCQINLNVNKGGIPPGILIWWSNVLCLTMC